jgi:hypothetical protein
VTFKQEIIPTFVKRSSSYRAVNTLRLNYTNHVILYTKINAVCCEIHKHYINAICGQKAELLSVQSGVYIKQPLWFERLINFVYATSLLIFDYWLQDKLTYLYYLLACSMEHSPSWEAKRFSASQEIPRILWNPKVHYRIHNSPPPVPILSHINPIQASSSHFLNIHFNIIVSYTSGSFKWSFHSSFPTKTLFAPLLSHSGYMPLPSHSSRFYRPCNICWGVH